MPAQHSRSSTESLGSSLAKLADAFDTSPTASSEHADPGRVINDVKVPSSDHAFLGSDSESAPVQHLRGSAKSVSSPLCDQPVAPGAPLSASRGRTVLPDDTDDAEVSPAEA